MDNRIIAIITLIASTLLITSCSIMQDVELQDQSTSDGRSITAPDTVFKSEDTSVILLEENAEQAEQAEQTEQTEQTVQTGELNKSTPGKNSEWISYATPEEAGWSSEKLDEAKKVFEELDSTALMIVYKGRIVAAWGDIRSKIPCHSIRKSFLSALYGIYSGEGKIDIEKTLKELEIDDIPKLTSTEKKAKIIDLLRARSGVYHTAAAETTAMKKNRPERGSYEPGEFWYYNNWDFNALGTIFNFATGEDLFKAFGKRIANPLGMEDFSPGDTHYSFEKNYSVHPAYDFTLSTRDMARFGLLFLNKGSWRGEQLIPKKWVEESTYPYTKTDYYGYGYMWWAAGNYCYDEDEFSAKGIYGNRIHVMPNRGLVIVHTVNSNIKGIKGVDDQDYDRLVRLILDARTGEEKVDPKLVSEVSGQSGR